MKRKAFLIITAILLCVCFVAVLVACNRQGGEKDNGNISRRTDAFFAGESEQFAVSVERGRREKTFIADGKATDVNDFAQITIVPLVKNEYESINFVLAGASSTLSGSVDGSDYGEFSAEIGLDFAPVSVTVTAGEETSEIELANVLEGALTADDVINIAKDTFKDRMDKESADGKTQREIYVKLITGDRENYYYYVSFIGDGVDYWAVLIDPKTGDIVSKK